MQLRNFDTHAFLRDIWQKRPLLIRNPWDDWSNPLEPDELAGLACEEGIEARLVTAAAGDWKVETGPLAEDRFETLGDRDWTLLVQAVDHCVPDVAALIEPFRFIPDWRIDDVMVSFAADGGGVGPHFDQYDVFLIQGLGTRRWEFGTRCDETSPLHAHDQLRLLADFQPVETFVLEPGDILYLPPGVSHNGVGIGSECMTYSIGFRAPSRSELIAHFCDHVLAGLDDDDRYEDRFDQPDSTTRTNPGEITGREIANLHAMVLEKMQDREAFGRWFGEYVSSPKYPDESREPEEPVDIEAVEALLNEGAVMCRNPASRFAFIREGDGAVLLFVDGEGHRCTGEAAGLAIRLCAEPAIEPGPLSSDALALLARLHNDGSIAFETGC
ncbi:MAG: cupin domain-containing protein [Novosphingobium sp.]|nr:cupin domain-containing protein [Novosphingobium sp.]